jgi:hypothetical protein
VPDRGCNGPTEHLHKRKQPPTIAFSTMHGCGVAHSVACDYGPLYCFQEHGQARTATSAKASTAQETITPTEDDYEHDDDQNHYMRVRAMPYLYRRALRHFESVQQRDTRRWSPCKRNVGIHAKVDRRSSIPAEASNANGLPHAYRHEHA